MATLQDVENYYHSGDSKCAASSRSMASSKSETACESSSSLCRRTDGTVATAGCRGESKVLLLGQQKYPP